MNMSRLGRHAPALVCALLSTLLAGCGTVFDPGPPAGPAANLTNANSAMSVMRAAESYAKAYDDRASGMAYVSPALELPAMGFAIAGVTALAATPSETGASRNLLLNAGSLLALETYLAPRTRMTVYLSGSAAMRCVAELARGVEGADGNTGMVLFSGQRTPSVAGLVAEAQNDFARTVFIQWLQAVNESVPALKDAIRQINTKIITRASAASKPVDLADLSNRLRTSFEVKQQKKEGALQALALTRGNALTAAFSVSPLMNALVLKQDLDGCIGQAG